MTSQSVSEGGIILKEGFLMKRGHVRHNWKTRWFKLSDTSLRYYKSKKDKVPQGRVSLRNAKLSIYHGDHKNDKDREFVMQVEASDGVVYPIQAPSNEELKMWMEYIRDVIEHLELTNDTHGMYNLFLGGDDTGQMSSAEILGNYIDAYGGIKRETRMIRGTERSDGFSGVALRVWIEHALGKCGTAAETTVTDLRRAGSLELVDGDPTIDAFANSKYYVLLSDEESIKETAGRSTLLSGSMKSSRGAYDETCIPPEILDASKFPIAVLPSDLPPGDIVKRGILFKKGHVVPSWKVRCFVLQQFPATFSYFDPSKKNPKVLNSLSLDGATVFTIGKTAAKDALQMKHPPEHLFCVKVSGGTLYLIMASSDAEMTEWIKAIKPLCRKYKSATPLSTDSNT